MSKGILKSVFYAFPTMKCKAARHIANTYHMLEVNPVGFSHWYDLRN